MSSVAINMCAAGLLVIAVAAVWLLLHLFGAGTEVDKTRLEVVKTAGTIVVGTGGAVALYLAARRQQSTERTLEHQREVAAVNEYDAKEQRVTEQYGRAADQLSSDKAPVRMAGIYALQRLGENNAELRQTIINVACAYLRMPFQFISDPSDVHVGDAQLSEQAYNMNREELEVRLAVQQMLIDKLEKHPRTRRKEGQWERMNVDLRKATLINFDMSYCTLFRLRCSEAILYGESDFRGIEATFADLAGAQFKGPANFLASKIKFADFKAAVFPAEVDVSFAQARFYGLADFERTNFGAIPQMSDAVFIYEDGGTWTGFDATKLEDLKRSMRELSLAKATPPGWTLRLTAESTERWEYTYSPIGPDPVADAEAGETDQPDATGESLAT